MNYETLTKEQVSSMNHAECNARYEVNRSTKKEGLGKLATARKAKELEKKASIQAVIDVIDAEKDLLARRVKAIVKPKFKGINLLGRRGSVAEYYTAPKPKKAKKAPKKA